MFGAYEGTEASAKGKPTRGIHTAATQVETNVKEAFTIIAFLISSDSSFFKHVCMSLNTRTRRNPSPEVQIKLYRCARFAKHHEVTTNFNETTNIVSVIMMT